MVQQHVKKYFAEIKQILDSIDLKKIEQIVEIIHSAYKNNSHIFILGNGGSAATASHFACDLGKGTLRPKVSKKIKRFKVTSLTDNVATMTAWSNDVGYNHIFSEQLKNLVNKGDIVIGISASGNSPNVLNAIKVAKNHKAITIGLTGFDGGTLAKISKISIIVKANKYDVVEDVHLILAHIITRYFLETINKTLK